MRKVAAVFSMVFGVVVLATSTSHSVMEDITSWRESLPWGSPLGNHQVENVGDLVRMAYLEEIPRFHDTVVHHYKKAGDGNQKINLYLFGDSYVKDIPDSVFYGLKSFHFGRRDYGGLQYNLDTTQTNILLIEIGERFVQRFFYTPEAIYEQVKKEEKMAGHYILSPAPLVMPKRYAKIFGFAATDFFNPNINQNIEYNLFSYNFASPVRTFKANLNAKIFKRASGDVVMSEDGNYLLLRETVTPKGLESSYAPVSNDAVSYHISIINQVYEHYKNEGFDEVYLSVIPNTASIIQPPLYNGFLPDLQNHDRGYGLKLPLIDVYHIFINNPTRYYLKGDTHWNHRGTEVWIQSVNAMLKAWDSNDSTRTNLTW